MTVVVYELNDEDEFEELGRSYDDGQTDEALLGIYSEEVWQEESDEWLVERLDGPYVVAEILKEKMDKRLQKFWSEYVGPNGGEGWQNLLTGEVRYQEDKPTTEDYDHGEEVREPDDDTGLTAYGGLSDGSFIRDHLPVTAKFTDGEGETHYGEIEEADIGGFRSEFIIAAANGKRYEVEEDDIEGYIEPDPEWNPDTNEDDEMWENQFNRVRDELGEGSIPPIPTRDMGIGGRKPEQSEFNHIGTGKVTEDHVETLRRVIDSGELGGLSVDFSSVGNDVDYGPWKSDISNWHDGGQFAHVDVEMPVEDFLATQATMLADKRDHPTEAHRSFYGSARADDVKEYAEVLESEPGEMPMPFIEVGYDGNMRNYQEGRHRAMAAMYAGHDTLPVRMVVNAERDGKHPEERVQWPERSEKLAKGWIPYQGPEGGEGWQSSENPEDVRYQEEPPGEIEPGYEEMAEGWGEGDDSDINPDEWEPAEIAEQVESIPDSQWEETESMADLSPGDFAVLEHRDADRQYPARIVDADSESMSFVTQGGLSHVTEVESEFMMGWELGQHASPQEQGVEELPAQFEDKYDAENVTGMDQLGDPAQWDGEFPFSPGQTLLGQSWDWTINSLYMREGEPRMGVEMYNGTKHTFGYVTDESKLGDLEPGWYRYPSMPSEENHKEFIGVVGEPEPYNFGYEPSEEVVANNDFDLQEAADRMANAVAEEQYENTDAQVYSAELIEEHDADFNALIELAEHGIEANGDTVDQDRDITEAEEIALNGVKRYLHNQAEEHPTLDGKLSLGFVSNELHEDFQSRMTPATSGEVSNVMNSWVNGYGSMVDESTIPLYALADETFENDFYPTREDETELIENADKLEDRKEAMELYRQKTIEVFREQWGDTIPVFRGYNPDSHSKGAEAREALEAEDGPDTIEMRNGVANSWSTDPTVAYQFSQWTQDNEPGVVVRQELPVENIFGASDTAPDLMGKETEIIAGNPQEISEHSRDDVFLPEEFNALEQAKWALERAQGEASKSEEKADTEPLRLDWELSSVGWMNEHEALEEVLLSKNWLPVVMPDGFRYQHTESGETVMNKQFGYSMTAARAGYEPAGTSLTVGDMDKAWVPYQGPRGGSGWRNTANENIRYVEDKPEGEGVDPSSLTEQAVEEAEIQQTFGLIQTTANSLQDGDLLTFNDGEYAWDLRVQEVTDESVEAIDTETRREISIPINEYGEPETTGARFHKPQAVFMGGGIAGADSSWLPEDTDEVTDTHLAAEALRSAAQTDGFGDTSYIEAFAARTSRRGIDRDRTIEAIEGALQEHPMLPVERADEIYENGQRLLAIEDSLREEKLLKAAESVQSAFSFYKEWIPYQGPQGGEGWQNVNNTDDIRYQPDAPGEIAEGYEEQAAGWGEDSSSDVPDMIQGAEVIEYPVPGSDESLHIPKNYTGEDLRQTLRRFRAGEGDLSMMLENVIAADLHMDGDDKSDVLRATAEVISNFEADNVDQFNELLHAQIRDNPNPDFETPFGMDGPAVHDLLEDTFGRFSDIVGDLEDSVLFDEDVNEDNAEAWVVAAQEWIRHNGDREMAQDFEEALNEIAFDNPFRSVEADIPDHMDPAKAKRVTPISETEADTGISANSMFIAEMDDGSRAFVTNTNWDRAMDMDGVSEQSSVDAKRAMAGYEAFKVADMEVPHHEYVEGEYWSVEESRGKPVKEWSGNPENINEEQFFKIGAVGMLSGNWDLHGGNVFVTEEGDLIPVDLDLSGHMLVDNPERGTAWGRLKRLGDTLGLFDKGNRAEVDEMKYEIARKVDELVEDGTANDIKSMASGIDHGGIQLNIEENVFAAKDHRLFNDEVYVKPTGSEGDTEEGDDPDIEQMVGDLMDNLAEDSEGEQ